MKGFTVTCVYINREGKEGYTIGQTYHWTWCEADQVYYCDVDDRFRVHPPKNGSRGLSLKYGCKMRMLVKFDR